MPKSAACNLPFTLNLALLSGLSDTDVSSLLFLLTGEETTLTAKPTKKLFCFQLQELVVLCNDVIFYRSVRDNLII